MRTRRSHPHSAFGDAAEFPETIRRELDALIEQTSADEIIATEEIFDQAARLRSFEIAAEIFDTLPCPRPLRASPRFERVQ